MSSYTKVESNKNIPDKIELKLNFNWIDLIKLPIFTAYETITNLTQYELSQEESDLRKLRL